MNNGAIQDMINRAMAANAMGAPVYTDPFVIEEEASSQEGGGGFSGYDIPGTKPDDMSIDGCGGTQDSSCSSQHPVSTLQLKAFNLGKTVEKFTLASVLSGDKTTDNKVHVLVRQQKASEIGDEYELEYLDIGSLAFSSPDTVSIEFSQPSEGTPSKLQLKGFDTQAPEDKTLVDLLSDETSSKYKIVVCVSEEGGGSEGGEGGCDGESGNGGIKSHIGYLEIGCGGPFPTVSVDDVSVGKNSNDKICLKAFADGNKSDRLNLTCAAQAGSWVAGGYYSRVDIVTRVGTQAIDADGNLRTVYNLEYMPLGCGFGIPDGVSIETKRPSNTVGKLQLVGFDDPKTSGAETSVPAEDYLSGQCGVDFGMSFLVREKGEGGGKLKYMSVGNKGLPYVGCGSASIETYKEYSDDVLLHARIQGFDKPDSYTKSSSLADMLTAGGYTDLVLARTSSGSVGYIEIGKLNTGGGGGGGGETSGLTGDFNAITSLGVKPAPGGCSYNLVIGYVTLHVEKGLVKEPESSAVGEFTLPLVNHSDTVANT